MQTWPNETWISDICTEFGIDPDLISDKRQQELLDVARDVAHNVARPATPITTYLLGIAVAQGADPATAAQTISARALSWEQTGS